MSVTCTLAGFALKYTFNQSADQLLGWLDDRFTDHSQTLPKALSRANDRAWQAVGLALAGDGLFDRVKDLFRDRDLTGLRDQIRAFLAATPTGLEMSPAGLRVRACDDLTRLRKAGRLSHAHDRAAVAADLRRYGNAGQLVTGAEQAVGAVADALTADAPHLAQLLKLAPAGGTPLLASAFVFFLRREVETNDELSQGLTFDSLRHLTAAQDRGFALLDGRTEGILDQLGLLFDELGAIRKEMREWRDSNKVAAVAVEASPVVSVSNEREQKRVRAFRDRLRNLPPEIVGVDDLSDLGGDLDACGLFEEALAAHQAAAGKAKADADRTAEAENAFRAYKDACETGKWAEAKESLTRAVQLDPRRFQPFDRSKYRLDTILGVGGFGTVFRCLDTDDADQDGNPVVVAIKSLRHENLDRDPRVVFSEARTLRDLYRPGSRLIRVISWGYAYADPDEPDRKERPYIVMEYFPGETLEAIVNRTGPLAVPDFLAVARQIVEAVQEAHTRNVYHRDLKPSNVMAQRLADGSWDVRVIDFGLAVRYESAYRASMNQASGRSTEKDRSLTGSLDFAPPEQRGKLPGVRVGPHSDVYAFGKTCAWLLFRTTDPKGGHWKRLPDAIRDPLKDLLEAATAEDLTPDPTHGEHQVLRLPNFDVVSTALTSLDPAERERQKGEAAERKRQTEAAERERVAAEAARKTVDERDRAEADRLRREVERLRQEQADGGRAERMELWKRSGAPRAWVLEHLDGWGPAEWTALVGGLTSSPYWPLKADEMGSYLEGLRAELRADRDRQREIERRREVERQRQEEFARRKAEEDAKLKDPLHPGRAREAGEKVSIKLPGDVKMTFAWCPPGTFLMGSEKAWKLASNEGKKNFEDERPVHRVTLTRGFYMGVYPVTQAQWKALTGATPSHFPGDNRPVECVSWDDCQEFCKKLTAHLKGRVTARLPWEAEWEYACRAGTTSEFHFGDVSNTDLVNYDGNYSWNGSPKGKYREQTTDVGSFPANPWGLFDVHGNVWEWCEDWYGPYADGNQTDPARLQKYSGEYRVMRGGSWNDDPRNCGAASRHTYGPGSHYNAYGFRVCFRLD